MFKAIARGLRLMAQALDSSGADNVPPVYLPAESEARKPPQGSTYTKTTRTVYTVRGGEREVKTESRPMTDAESKATDECFDLMDQGFKQMDAAFSTMSEAVSKLSKEYK